MKTRTVKYQIKMMSSEKIIKAFFTFLLIWVSLFAHGQTTTTWQYSGSGTPSWDNAAHWSNGAPYIGSEVIIPQNDSNTYPQILASSGNVFAARIHIESGAKLTSQAGSLLQIFPFAGDNAILNDGTLNINGEIRIDGGGSGDTEKGIRNAGTCNLTGTLLLAGLGSGLAGQAIRNDSDGQFTVDGGTIEIGKFSGIDGYGIYNFGDFTVNSGSNINIDRNTEAAITNQFSGIFVNSGTIKIGTIASELTGFNAGINNSGSFTNNNVLEIEDATGNGIFNSSEITLHGDVTIINSGINGIYNFSTSSQVNMESSLKLDIQNQASSGYRGILNNGSITLDPGGELNIESSDDGIINNKTFSVNGKVTINTTPGSQKDAIENNDLFNLITPCEASLHITSNSPINNNALFVNDGVITYEGTKTSNITINRELVISTEGNFISIDTDNGTYIQEDKTVWLGCESTSWNEADNWSNHKLPESNSNILITSYANNNPQISSTETVNTVQVNESKNLTIFGLGDLTCIGSSNHSLTILGEVTNNGYIRISNNANNTGIDCQGTLTNNSIILIEECQIGIKNEGNITANEFGLILVDNVSSTGILNNGTITNHGQLNFGVLAALGGNAIVNNSDFTVSSNCRASIDIKTNNPIIDNSNFINDGFINYNGTQNSTINVNNGFVVSKQGDFISIATDNGVYAANDYVIWTGCNSTFWSDPLNWTKATGPLSTDNVLIVPNTPNEPILSSTSNLGTLKIEEFVSLVIPSNGVLNLSGSDHNSIEVNGLLLNEGTINISNNPTNRGISCNEIFLNLGTVSISDCNVGIYVEEDTEFENDDDGIINIDGCTDGLILNSDGINAGNLTIDNVTNGIRVFNALENSGSVTINNYEIGISVQNASLDNYGTISLGQNSSSYKEGIRFESSTFNNNLSAELNIYNYTTGFYSIFSTLNNHGTIFIDKGDTNAIFSQVASTFVNTNTITIGTSSNENGQITFVGDFTNSENATLIATSSNGVDLNYRKAFINNSLIQVDGDIISNPASNTSGNGTIQLEGSWIAIGDQDMDEMTVKFDGNQESTLDVSLEVEKLIVEKNSSELILGENQSIVSEIEMVSGILNLNGRTIELATGASIQGEDENTYIFDQAPTFGGSIVYTESLNSPNNKNLGNLGCIVTSVDNLGQFTVVRSHNPIVADGITTINRNFNIDYSNPVADVILNMEYLDHETTPLDESIFGVYKYTDAMNLNEYAVTGSSTFFNTIQISGQDLTGTFTFGESDKTFYWTGSEGEDWYNPNNWSITGVPNNQYDVIIPNVSNDPYISGTDPNESATCKSLVLMEDAILTNDGNIISFNSASVGFTIHGDFNNGVDASIAALNASSGGFHITESGTCINEGLITKFLTADNGTYILNDGVIQNSGIILIIGNGINPIENNTTGSFENHGVIDIATSQIGSFTGIAGILNKGDFSTSSSSEIDIRYLDHLAILNEDSAEFLNLGIIDIGQNGGANIVGDGLENQGNFTNYNTINIDKVSANGVNNEVGTFTNYNTLNIGQSYNNSIGQHGIQSNTEFHNLGTINLGSTGENGIYLTDVDSDFVNEGGIHLGLNKSISSNAIFVEGSSQFNNLSSGVIEMKNANNGIVIGSEVASNEGSFLNVGELYFSEITNFGLNNYDEFNNTGIIGGEGSIKTSSTDLGGTISPGFSPGQINFVSEIVAQAGSVLKIEVEGTSLSQHDNIQSEDFITISDMSLDVQINYAPQTGDRIIFLEAAVVIGEFASLITSLPVGWTIDYSGEYVALEFAAVLPVELLSFDAELNEQSVHLIWNTASEVNNEGFDILHSTDLEDWNEVGFVHGYGNSHRIQEYYFDHAEPEQGNNYYKLRQVDFDGSYSDSDVKVVFVEQRVMEYSVQLFPNPTTDYINIEWDNEENTFSAVQIIDMRGQLLKEFNTDAIGGKLQTDVSTLPTGSYTLLLISHDQVVVKRFNKTDF